MTITYRQNLQLGKIFDYGQTQNPQLNRSQLTAESSTRANATFSYGYDGGTSGGPGNPTSFKGHASTFNADNQVTNTGYAYNGNGSPTTYKGQALTFDPEQRLTGYNGSTQTDGYDGDGLRAWKQAASVKTYFLYDGSEPVCEYNGSGTLTATSTFGADGLVSRRTSATAFYLFDERGSVTQRTTSTGSVLSSDVYDAFGTRSSTGGADVFGYGAQAGYYTDSETGLILCTHRYYDPSTGRWLTRDHITYGGGINIYGYTKNNPTNWIDPSGYSPVITGPPGGFGGGIPLPICDPIDLVLCAQLCFGRQMGGGTCVIVVGGSAPGLYCLCVEIKIVFDACTGAETKVPVYTYVYTPSNIRT